jgi:hypothetical protein
MLQSLSMWCVNAALNITRDGARQWLCTECSTCMCTVSLLKTLALVIHVAAQVLGQCTGYALAKVAQAVGGGTLSSSTPLPAGTSFQYKLTVSYSGTPPGWNAGQLHIEDILPSGVELDGSAPTGCQSTSNANVLCILDPAVKTPPADFIIPVKVSSSANTGVANLVITNTAGLSAVITVNGQQQYTPCATASASITVPPVSAILTIILA